MTAVLTCISNGTYAGALRQGAGHQLPQKPRSPPAVLADVKS